MKTCFHLLAGVMALIATSLHAAVPLMTSYRGRVQVSGTNFNGAGQFKFALIGKPSGVSLWSNDGTSVDGSEPVAAVPINVMDGSFSVLLGDASLANMLPLTASIFVANSDVCLRVWFNDGANGSVQIIPDDRLASVPYALAANIANGAVTNEHLAPASIDPSKLNVANSPQIGRLLSYDGMGFSWVDGSVAGNIWSLNGSDTYYPAGSVGIGTNAPTAGYRLDVNGLTRLAPGGSGGAILFGTPNFESGMTIQGTARADLRFDGAAVKLVAGPIGGPPSSANGITVTTAGKVGIGTETPARKLTVHTSGGLLTDHYGIEHTDGAVRLSTFINGDGGWLGTVTRHPLNFYVNDGAPSLAVDTNGHTVITPNGGVGGYGRTVFGTPNGESGMSIVGEDASPNRADLRFNGSSVKLLAGPGAGPPGSTSGITVSTNGNVGIGMESSADKLAVNGTAHIGASARISGSLVVQGSVSGADLSINGHARQMADASGFVKAMAFVDGNGTVLRSYNPYSTNTTVQHIATGGYEIDFGFKVDDRFYSVTPQYLNGGSVGASFFVSGTTKVQVGMARTGNSNPIDYPFMIIVY